MDMDNAEGFGQRLTAARIAAGNPSFRRIERRAVEILGPYAPTSETIRLYHAGKVTPEKADIVLAAFLANYFGVELSDLSVTIANRADKARDLLVSKLCCIAA